MDFVYITCQILCTLPVRFCVHYLSDFVYITCQILCILPVRFCVYYLSDFVYIACQILCILLSDFVYITCQITKHYLRSVFIADKILTKIGHDVS
jgi:hypothetical protein